MTVKNRTVWCWAALSFWLTATAAHASAYDLAHANHAYVYHVAPATCSSSGKSLVTIKHAPNDFEAFYTALSDGHVAQWRYGQASPTWTELLDGSLAGLAPSPDGAMVAVLGSAEMIQLLSSENGALLPRHFSLTDADPGAINTAISWSSYQNIIATGDSKGKVRLWLPDQEQPIATLHHDDHAIKSLAFTKSGRFLVAVTGKDVLLWNVDEGTSPFQLKDQLGLDDLSISDAQLPEFNENYLTVTTGYETLIIDLSAQRIMVRYPTPIAQRHATGPFGAYQGPLFSLLSPDLSKIVRIYKNPMFDKVDAESGVLQTLYLDPDLSPTMNQMPVTVAGAIKPDNGDTVLLGVKRMDFSGGCISSTVDVLQYGL